MKEINILSSLIVMVELKVRAYDNFGEKKIY